MKVYEAAFVRNVVLLGHQGSGKTTLAEAILFVAGAVGRMGSVEEKTTASDYRDVEQQRGMSVFATLLRAEHDSFKLNLLDTPGYADFIGEVIASLAVADAALFVVNAAGPVEVGTDSAWDLATRALVPSLFVVNHCDKPGVDFHAAIAALRQRYGRGVTVLAFPGPNRSLIDVLAMKQLVFPAGKGTPEVREIDEGLRGLAAELRTALVENVAENDEALMLEYLEEGTLTDAQVRAALIAAVHTRLLFPVVPTAAPTLFGVARLLGLIGELCPSPLDARSMRGQGDEDRAIEASGEPLAFCFRTLSEPHVGEYSLLKVLAGTLEPGMDLENAATLGSERLGQLYSLSGKAREALPKLHAGDLGATVKLKDTATGATLRTKGSSVAARPIAFPEARFRAAIGAVNEGEEDKLSTGLHKIISEDPSLTLEHDALLGQILLGGQGEMHLELVKQRLKSRYAVEVELSVPKVSYRETILKTATASYRHKKQSGGAGQFADSSLIVAPLVGEYQPPPEIKVRAAHVHDTDWGARLELIDAIVSGVIDMKRFASAIQKGILEAMRKGPLAGYPCGDLRVVVVDGKMHSVDSNEAAFKTASRHCFQEAFQEAAPVLLEPICDLEVLVPDGYMGDVMSDLSTRRARIQGMEAAGALQKVTATAPEVELLRYATELRSISQGRGRHSAHFRQYEPMPRVVQDKVVLDARRSLKAAE